MPKPNKYLFLFLFAALHGLYGYCQQKTHNSQTLVVLLGTGTPNPDPERSGPALAVIVNNTSYVVDCGPGVVRRCEAAAEKYGIQSLQPDELKHLFITHLHSDHTIGYPDFILTGAVAGRNSPLQVYGPKGIASMTDHLLKAYYEDIDIRVNGLEHENPIGYKVDLHEITAGIVYQDDNVTVKAFKVHHGSWPEAFGYRFKTKDRVIVVSGDCTYSEDLVKNAMDCDVLVHEVYSAEGLARRQKGFRDYHSAFHTSTIQLADIANKTKPKLLVLTHQLTFGASEEQLMHEITNLYPGKVIYGNDLDIF